MSEPLAMFPLGSVLFPGMLLPLHVFEPRYRALVRSCLDGDGEFGVVLIERGSEVGGGDVRTMTGTVAQIIDAREAPDGRWGVLALGVRRMRVRRWLADDPHPWAEVEDWPDEPDEPTDLAAHGAASDPAAALAGVVAQLRRVLALRAELGDDVVAATVELADDPAIATFQIAASGPFGPVDQQVVLDGGSVATRLAILARLLDDDEVVLRQRLALS